MGTGGLSIGPAGNGAPPHLAGLSHGMVFVEALSGLAAVAARGAWFLFLPVRLAGGAAVRGGRSPCCPGMTTPEPGSGRPWVIPGSW
jgi:hypothetical protein